MHLLLSEEIPIRSSAVDEGLFIRRLKDGKRHIVCVHVDDMLSIAPRDDHTVRAGRLYQHGATGLCGRPGRQAPSGGNAPGVQADQDASGNGPVPCEIHKTRYPVPSVIPGYESTGANGEEPPGPSSQMHRIRPTPTERGTQA